MKKILFLLLATSQAMYGQSGSDTSDTANDLIVEYAHDHIGEKIGQGVCSEFISGAMKYVSSFGMQTDSLYPVSEDSLKPGDIVVFEKVVSIYGDSIDNHIGIVCSLFQGKSILYANQNVQTSTDIMKAVKINGSEINVYEDSHVVMSEISLKNIAEGKVLFFRL